MMSVVDTGAVWVLGVPGGSVLFAVLFCYLCEPYFLFISFFPFCDHNCDKLSEIINLQRGMVYFTPRVGGSSPQSAEVCAVSSTLVSSSSWQERIAEQSSFAQ